MQCFFSKLLDNPYYTTILSFTNQILRIPKFITILSTIGSFVQVNY